MIDYKVLVVVYSEKSESKGKITSGKHVHVMYTPVDLNIEQFVESLEGIFSETFCSFTHNIVSCSNKQINYQDVASYSVLYFSS